MDYNELVESIVEDLLGEKLYPGETKADKGSFTRTHIANNIRHIRAHGDKQWDSTKAQHRAAEGEKPSFDIFKDQASYAIDDASSHFNLGDFEKGHKEVAKSLHYANAKRHELNRQIDREERHFLKGED